MGITSMLAKAAIPVAGAAVGNKAMIIAIGDGIDIIPVQFNPSQYSITDSAVYSQRERRKEDEPAVNYNGAMLSTLSAQLIFNSAEFTSVESIVNSINDTIKKLLDGDINEIDDGDITGKINRIANLTKIVGDKHQPPGCAFIWGSLLFLGYVESVGVTYTMFDSSGRPISAVVNLTMRGFNGAAGERGNPLLSPDRTKARVMTEDASIWQMAEKEYGDVREWRRIAESNDIMNPLDIPVGKVLRVPSINE